MPLHTGDKIEAKVGDVSDGSQVAIGKEIHQTQIIIQRNGREIRLPLQRPPRAEHFTDRQEELAQLLQDLQPGRIVTLCGPGGIGKSALAAEAMWRLTPGDKPPDQFPDGIVFYSFYGRPDSALAFEHIVRSFDEDVRDTSFDMAFRMLAGKQAVLLLDGTEEADDLPLVLNVRGNCGVIVTSRKREDAVAEPQRIGALQTEEARKLLQAWGKEHADDTAAVQKICELVGGLPLAVRLAGRYLNTYEECAAEYLEWLQTSPLEALHQGERKIQSVPLLIERSLTRVSEEACHVLTVAGLLAFASFSREVLEAVLPDVDLRKPLQELVNYGLLLRSGDRYTISHALIHTYARERMTRDAASITRLAAYYNAFAREQREQGLEGYTRLDAERAHILRVIEACKEQEEWQSVTDLVWAIGTHDGYLAMQGYWTEWQTTLEMGVEAAQHLENRYNEGAFWGNLGSAYYFLGQATRAIKHHQQAVNIFREIGDKRNEGAYLGNLGSAYRDLGQVEKAIEYYEQALTIDREIGSRQVEGIRLGNLGNAYYDLGQVEKAIEYYELALAIDREIGYRQGEGIRLGNLSGAYRTLGQLDKAISFAEQGLAIAREIKDPQSEGFRHWELGRAYKDLHQVDKAREYLQQALRIFRQIKSPYADEVRKDLAELEGKSDE